MPVGRQPKVDGRSNLVDLYLIIFLTAAPMGAGCIAARPVEYGVDPRNNESPMKTLWKESAALIMNQAARIPND